MSNYPAGALEHLDRLEAAETAAEDRALALRKAAAEFLPDNLLGILGRLDELVAEHPVAFHLRPTLGGALTTFAHAVTDALGDRTPDETAALAATLDGTVDPDNDTLERWVDADRRTYTPNARDVLAASLSPLPAVAHPPVPGDGGASPPAASRSHAAGGTPADTRAEAAP